MKKTPLQKLIDNLYLLMSVQANLAVCHGINYSIQEAEKLLEEEKQMVMDAWIDGEGRFFDVGTEIIEAEKYFNQTFEQ